jgi:flavin-dependent dehydrogenase
VLARRGARVTIFDPSHPREKPCGGGVTGRALDLVRDSIDVSSLARTRITAARFGGAARSARIARVVLDDDALVVASRAAFDGAMLDAAMHAGAVVERARVIDVNVDSAGAELRTTSGRRRASFVVGADGANSLVRRRVAAPFRRDQLSIATGFFARGVTSSEIAIEMANDPPGYIWSFPRPDHLAIGICAQAGDKVTSSLLRARVGRWIADTQIAGGAPLQPYAWPIPSLSASDFGALQVASPRWALVGDAAGFVDPITREGIYFAIASGGWIADALAAADACRTYTARVHDEAIPELARAARLKAGFFRPAFVSLMVRALQESAAIRAVMADLVAGRQPYATLKWRLIKTFEVRLAWRALTA